MDIVKVFKTDQEAEKTGKWEDFGGGTRCKIARHRNPRYMEVSSELTKAHQGQIRRGTLPEELADKILIETMARTILVGWEGMKENGIEIPYSKENAIRLLTDYPDFRNAITEISQTMDFFREQEIEEGVENL